MEHLVVQIGIPIAYPRMVFLETALESKFNPLVALGRTGTMGLSGFVNKFNAEAELLDDLVSLLRFCAWSFSKWSCLSNGFVLERSLDGKRTQSTCIHTVMNRWLLVLIITFI